MTDDDSERVQVNFLVSEEQKNRWQDAASEKGFRGYSDFIRTTIEKEIKSDESAGSEDIDALNQQIGDLTETVNQLAATVQDMDTRLQTLEQEVRDDPEVKQIASDIFGILPTREELLEVAKAHEVHKCSGTVESIAAHLDREQYKIEQGLNRLQSDSNQVQSLVLNDAIEGWSEYREGGDERRYYRLE